MGSQKENKVISKHDVLQRIPLDMYNECSYADTLNMYTNLFKNYMNLGFSAVQCVLFQYNEYETMMNENGMEKFVALISGMLFMIENDEVHTDVAYGVNWDIKDFETGNYDDLFTPEDLALIKNNIKLIKNYIKKHPELLLDENEDKIFKEGKFV